MYYSDFPTLRDTMNRLFEESYLRPRARGRGGEREQRELWLPVDAYETPNEVVIFTSLPGVNPDQVNITFQDNTLTISGAIPLPGDESQNWVLHERAHGPFRRSLTFNVPVDANNANAEFHNGVLHLTIPKSEEARPKQIKVTAKGQPAQLSQPAQR